MLGRLIVALLVVCSAAFVMLQKRETESTSIGATLADTRAKEAEQRAADQEKKIAGLQAQVEELETKVAWQDERFTELAEDCTPASPEIAEVEIATLKRRPAGGDVLGLRDFERNGREDQRFALVLRGDAGTITRARLFSSLDDGTELMGKPSCDTLDGDSTLLMGVVAGGKHRVTAFGPQEIAKKAGVVPFELLCDLVLDRARPLTVELLFAGGSKERMTIGPAVDQGFRRPGQ
jgi:uncharacterized coiled-coil protein SlyX